MSAFLYRDDIKTLLQKSGPAIEAQESSDEPPPIKVLAQKVVILPNDRVFEAVGTGRARLSIQLYPAVNELVEEVLFQAGDIVTKGQLLVELEDDEELLAERLAQVNLRDSEGLLNRYQKAGQEGAVPESEVDSAQANFEAAQVALDQARLEIEKRKVHAPFEGVIGLPQVDPGDRIDTNTTISNLDDRSVILVDYEVPESLLGAVTNNQATSIVVTTSAYPGRTFPGSLKTQESRINAQRRTLMMRASIQNDEDLLRPGMSFTILWTIPGEAYPTVPEISLQWSSEGSFVWAVREGKAVQVPAKVIARTAGMVLLDGELEDGETVVIEGV